ncbi:MAG: hypothetical protein A3J28_07350 [Acidobacteria bacterium RIFCSPLOWO2_12_FULL_60_22]|nr:MAG: hypothetical protein A3J28_07350 [Acidobacteria bacterium RIFCSPLOWO2_12_FULL_60_22]
MEKQNGYVALLDVLGFTEIVSGEAQAEKLSQYVHSLEMVTNETDVDIVLFSDTIVMTSLGNTRESLLSILQACSQSFGLLLSREIAVRGAVSYGSFIRHKSPKGVFLAGRAIIDAYRFQQKQNWVGIMIAPTVLETQPDLGNLCNIPLTPRTTKEQIDDLSQRFEWAKFIQGCDGIPFRESEQRYNGLAVVPTEDLMIDPDGILAYLKQAKTCLERLKSLAPDPQSQRKYTETFEWLGVVRNRWSHVSNDWNHHRPNDRPPKVGG